MREWKITRPDEQTDDLGNVFQRSGGVIPKACQKCETDFNNPIQNMALMQEIPLFSCSCEFKSNSVSPAMEHILENSEHKIKKSSEKKVVGYQNIITGSKPIIKKIEKDGEVVEVEILCENCYNV